MALNELILGKNLSKCFLIYCKLHLNMAKYVNKDIKKDV